MVLFPDEFRCSRSLGKRLRSGVYTQTLDQAFDTVMRCCAAPRHASDGTWITPEMFAAYANLHRLGFAHSVETWCAGKLVGGLYGVQLGSAFFGESMFSLATDASKTALATLVAACKRRSIRLIDCQMSTPHLQSLGARNISRREFIALLQQNARKEADFSWREA